MLNSEGWGRGLKKVSSVQGGADAHDVTREEDKRRETTERLNETKEEEVRAIDKEQEAYDDDDDEGEIAIFERSNDVEVDKYAKFKPTSMGGEMEEEKEEDMKEEENEAKKEVKEAIKKSRPAIARH